MITHKFDSIETLEKRLGRMSLGYFLKSLREADSIPQTIFAKKLRISRANLCDIEKGRKFVSPERAIFFARLLKLPEETLLKLSIQDILHNSNMNYEVALKKIA